MTVPHELCLPMSGQELPDPFSLKSRLSSELASLLYDGLFSLGADFSPVPALAESWAFSDDGLSLTVSLKSAVFSDGTPVTADDVVYSFSRYLKENTIYSSSLSGVSSVSSEGDRAVVFSLSAPNGELPALLTMPVVRKEKSGASLPVGSGRYLLLEEDGGFSLSANPRWYGGACSLETVRLQTVASADQLLHCVTSGLVSAAESTPLNPSAPCFRGNFESVSFPTLSMYFVALNCRAAPLRDVRVRQALHLIFDREAIAAEACGGLADPAVFPVHPDSPFSPKASLSPDLSAASALLEEAGLIDRNGDGLRELPGGEALSLPILVNEDNEYKLKAARMLSDQAAKAGLSLPVVSLPFGEMTARVRTGDFSLCLCEASLSPDFNLSAFLSPGGEMNFSGLSYDTLPASGEDGEPAGPSLLSLKEACAAAIDPEAQVRAFHALYAGFSRLSPFLPLCFERNLLLFRESSPTGVFAVEREPFLSLHQWQYS